jgi:galactokinase
MDQMASLLGRPDAGTFLDCRTLDAEVTELGFASAGLELVVIDTKVSHAHSTGGYGERRAACERGAQIMGVPALRDLSVADLRGRRS